MGSNEVFFKLSPLDRSSVEPAEIMSVGYLECFRDHIGGQNDQHNISQSDIYRFKQFDLYHHPHPLTPSCGL